MCSKISHVEIAQLCDDFKALIEEGYDRKDVYGVLQILALRQQIAKLELINRALIDLNNAH